MNMHITAKTRMASQLKRYTTIGDIAASALALGVLTADQEFHISESLWLGHYSTMELDILDRLLDALVEGSVHRLDIRLAA